MIPDDGFDVAALQQRWLGHTYDLTDAMAPERAAAWATATNRCALADDLIAGSSLPHGWHWFYFHEHYAPDEQGTDGHRRLGIHLPEVAGVRRMWASSELTFDKPIQLGVPADKQVRVTGVKEKQGRIGRLLFVTVEQSITQAGAECLTDRQTLVYKPAVDSAKSDKARPVVATPDPAWCCDVSFDEITLFRYSALTYNAHRIHYDHRYATSVEGYPGLVVHGPLLASSLLDSALQHVDAIAHKFRFKATSPIFCGEAVQLCGGTLEGNQQTLWVSGPNGLALSGELVYR